MKEKKGEFDDQFTDLVLGKCDILSSDSEKDIETASLEEIRKLPVMSNTRMELYKKIRINRRANHKGQNF